MRWKFNILVPDFLTSSISDDDDGTFALAVADAVTEHASKSREDWRIELAAADFDDLYA